jgi:O-antigen/teichoic acid export membrane protein
MSASLQEKAVSGVVWNGLQRFGTLSISLLSNVVLARLLSPEDFGCIAMLVVFTSIASTLVEGGLDSALIQKKQPSSVDYCTVFYFNLAVAALLYATLFFAAPAIAFFYRTPQLSLMLRVLGASTIVGAMGIVQRNQLQKHLNFRKLTAINLVAVVLSTITGIGLAVAGCGAWSLVAKSLVTVAITTGLLWGLSSWRPVLVFSAGAFRQLFSFGGLVLLSNISESIVAQLVSLIIGRAYSPKTLGYYRQAANLVQIPEMTIPYVVNQVLFPVLSSIQDDTHRVAAAVRRSEKILAFCTFPLMVSLALVAKPLIVVLFSDKWMPSVPYFQLLCFGGMLCAVNVSNITVLYAMGRGKSIFVVGLIKRAITLIALLVGVCFGVYGLVVGSVLAIHLWFPVNAYWTRKVTGYGLWRQLGDIAPIYLMAVAVGGIVYWVSGFMTVENNYCAIGLLLTLYGALYVGCAWVLRSEALTLCLGVLRNLAARWQRR